MLKSQRLGGCSRLALSRRSCRPIQKPPKARRQTAVATIRRFFATPNCPRFALLAEPELHARDGCGALEIKQDGYEPPQCNEPIAAERRGYNLMFLPQPGLYSRCSRPPARVFLYNPRLAFQVKRVRGWPFVFAFLLQITTASAQEQERKLIDRLLKPDTALQNPQQTKSFSQRHTISTHSNTTRSFYIAERNLSRNFVADRQFATTSYSSGNFETKAASQMKVHGTSTFSTRAAREVPTASNGSKNFSTGGFGSTRPFLVRGKSQKSLDAQHHPLTIEQVRELLNKNK